VAQAILPVVSWQKPPTKTPGQPLCYDPAADKGLKRRARPGSNTEIFEE
jgi:hypothetical protein